jgi:hypothetical protein
MNNKRFQAAHILVRTTWMDSHPALRTTDCEVNQIDWDTIDNQDWSLKEQILIEVLRFVTTNQSHVQLDDLLTLSQIEQQAVLLSLTQVLSPSVLEENLVND